jgi:hypothetical protein
MAWYNELGWLAGPGGAAATGGSMPGGGSGASGLGNWLFGGDAAAGVDGNLRNGDYLSGFIRNQLGQPQQGAPTVRAANAGGAQRLNLGANGQIDPQLMATAGRLGQIATGQQKGAGELAVDRQVSQATAQQQAAARMARGANAALAARNAARNTVDLGVAGAGQASMAQLNDASAANQQLGALLSGMRGQNIDVASQNAQLGQQMNLANAGFGQQAALANQGASMQQQQMNQNYQLGLLAQLLGVDTATLQAQLAKANVAAGDQGHLAALLQTGGSAVAGGAV